MRKTVYFFAALILFFNPASVNAELKNVSKQSIAEHQITQSPKSIVSFVGSYDKEIKFVFSDVDGTIVPLSDNGVQPMTPQSASVAAKKLRDANIPFVIVTGRAPNEIQVLAKPLGNNNTYFILLQGGEIRNPKWEVIYQDFIKGDDAKAILKSFEKYRDVNKFNSQFYMVVDGDQYSDQPFVLPYNGKRVKVKQLDDFEKGFSVGKIGIYEPDLKKCKMIQEYLKKQFSGYRVDISGVGYCDISSATATKGNAIKKLSGILNIDLGSTAVFGDAENDLSMFKLINKEGGLTISVANGMDILKQNSDYVTDTVWAGGFAKGVDKILENNARLNCRCKSKK